LGRSTNRDRSGAPQPFVAFVLPWVVLVGVAVATIRPGTSDAAVRATVAHEAVRDRYLADCAVCHGADGRGTVRGPSLLHVGRASVDYQLSTGRMPLAPAVRTDREGRPLVADPNRTLPDPSTTSKRHDPAYSPSEIKALVDYVADLGKGGPDIPEIKLGDRANGGELFRLQCAACHAWAGDGGALSHREAPPLHDATPVQIAEAVRVGPGQMPAFGQAALDKQQLNDVVAYVRYLDHPEDRGGRPLGHLGPVAEGAVALLAIGFVLLLLRAMGERG